MNDQNFQFFVSDQLKDGLVVHQAARLHYEQYAGTSEPGGGGGTLAPPSPPFRKIFAKSPFSPQILAIL